MFILVYNKNQMFFLFRAWKGVEYTTNELLSTLPLLGGYLDNHFELRNLLIKVAVF
jgi:hypothetical protein